ncbi:MULTISPECIES: hypothetical protein [unclassified Methanosarcina]|uniref:hypothetical protein n=1 Tax=unclassified Methanosarcina TaxID=2644672 RepID=UPI000A8A8912|nr:MULTISPECIES: hypothetical protein [unclassified Methanosarcina]
MAIILFKPAIKGWQIAIAVLIKPFFNPDRSLTSKYYPLFPAFSGPNQFIFFKFQALEARTSTL